MPAPPPLGDAVDATLIEDRYLLGTRLRVRRTTGLAGGEIRCKLGQKVRPDPADAGLILHTTMYLSAEEYEQLSRLPGAELRKVRHVLVWGGRRVGVDVFEGRYAGLVLAEVQLADPDEAVVVPAFAGPEVTGDERYTGGWLAFATDEALTELRARGWTREAG